MTSKKREREKVLYIRIPEAQHAALERIAKADDRSLTSLVRRIVNEAITRSNEQTDHTPARVAV